MDACSEGHKDIVQLLLEHSSTNFDLNARDNAGRTAIDLAALLYGGDEIVKLLLEHGQKKGDLAD